MFCGGAAIALYKRFNTSSALTTPMFSALQQLAFNESNPVITAVRASDEQ